MCLTESENIVQIHVLHRFKTIYLFENQSYKESEGTGYLICWLIPRMAVMTRDKPGASSSVEGDSTFYYPAILLQTISWALDWKWSHRDTKQHPKMWSSAQGGASLTMLQCWSSEASRLYDNFLYLKFLRSATVDVSNHSWYLKECIYNRLKFCYQIYN